MTPNDVILTPSERHNILNKYWNMSGCSKARAMILFVFRYGGSITDEKPQILNCNILFYFKLPLHLLHLNCVIKHNLNVMVCSIDLK